MNYEDLLIEADENSLIAKEKPLLANKGRIKGNRIAIKSDLSECEKACVLAEELGHYYTSSGDILNQNTTSDIKQEHCARLWAYNKQIGLHGLIAAYKANCMSTHDMAEYLSVTEEFLIDAIECYRGKYGIYTVVQNYIIGFEPTLYIIEKFE